MSNSIQLPKYKCHKEVWALKIKEILPNEATGDCFVIEPTDKRYAQFHVPIAYVTKHKPEPGGYYVKYPDGYTSYSPAEAFEDGYTLIK